MGEGGRRPDEVNRELRELRERIGFKAKDLPLYEWCDSLYRPS